jgi:thioredoxin-like negative regulator of GroEL
MSDAMIEAVARAICCEGAPCRREARGPKVPCKALASWIEEYTAAIAAAAPLIREQVEREIVAWLRKEAVFSTDTVRRRIIAILDAFEAGEYRK